MAPGPGRLSYATGISVQLEGPVLHCIRVKAASSASGRWQRHGNLIRLGVVTGIHSVTLTQWQVPSVWARGRVPVTAALLVLLCESSRRARALKGLRVTPHRSVSRATGRSVMALMTCST